MKKQTGPKIKINFMFDEQEDAPLFDVDMKLKTIRREKHIKIIEHKRKRKVTDVSTQLF